MKINRYGVDCTGWEILNSRLTIDALGFIPAFIWTSDPRPASAQINERYVYGGWHPQKGWAKAGKPGDYWIKYPEDPIQKPLARFKLRDEVILLYPSSYVGIFGPKSFEVARVD